MVTVVTGQGQCPRYDVSVGRVIYARFMSSSVAVVYVVRWISASLLYGDFQLDVQLVCFTLTALTASSSERKL